MCVEGSSREGWVVRVSGRNYRQLTGLRTSEMLFFGSAIQSLTQLLSLIMSPRSFVLLVCIAQALATDERTPPLPFECDQYCDFYEPGSYCKHWQNPPVCFKIDIPCYCSDLPTSQKPVSTTEEPASTTTEV
ncbi:hypothetical protein FOZ60_002229 [Perkinsus olseni]|uniref:Uncharacterized protein n=1 Tax=Perkinsus olseni TaxID=32597 RepID=A0A7J6NYD6_PEROL|nr:hypothetical protein FOZ60_002229 [Perkinsus olseni]